MVVEDMAESIRFYSLLGLDFPADAAGEGHAEAELGGGLRLMLDTIEVVKSFSEWEPASGGHRIGLAFRCQSPSTVDETYAEIVRAGYRSSVEPFDAFWGQRYATVLDPDGNPVDLYATL